MEKRQTKLLLGLAKKLNSQKRSKEVALNSLKSAGLLTSSGKVTKNFPNLNRVLSNSAQ
ncbi:hypothetical protein [Subsaximicrobium wynnwilliamsii]|uniref:hypothetical protein n=1 Tax=Subsaximicrobium wynnwilliamsii TaxID=291179 RepID=UPI00167C0CB2|nr:hypothetical protein [Subsaximicrobium wynnwilliamsii]